MLTQDDITIIKKVLLPEFTKLDKKIGTVQKGLSKDINGVKKDLSNVEKGLSEEINEVKKEVKKVRSSVRKLHNDLETIAYRYDVNYLNLKKRVDLIDNKPHFLTA